jgi:hypothetical protein
MFQRRPGTSTGRRPGKLILEPAMRDFLVKKDALAWAYPTILIDFPQLRIPGAQVNLGASFCVRSGRARRPQSHPNARAS